MPYYIDLSYYYTFLLYISLKISLCELPAEPGRLPGGAPAEAARQIFSSESASKLEEKTLLLSQSRNFVRSRFLPRALRLQSLSTVVKFVRSLVRPQATLSAALCSRLRSPSSFAKFVRETSSATLRSRLCFLS